MKQRSSPRVQCKARFVGTTAQVVDGDILDVSKDGLQLRARGNLTQGNSLHLDFRLPTGRVEALGEVRWVKRSPQGTSAGVRFVRISHDALRLIEGARSKGFASGPQA